MKILLGGLALLLACLGYSLEAYPEMREEIGRIASSIARPIVIPAVELINVPAFVYVVSFIILASGVTACLVYRFAVLGSRLSELRQIRVAVGDMPLPRARGGRDREGWAAACHQLGELFSEHAMFVSAWSAFLSEAVRVRGVPQRPFSAYVAQEPDPPSTGDDIMTSLPGYFTSVGLIFTFIGLVVALYFAAKGFRTGDIGEARAAIIQLLNAASFKFLTSVSALISALIVSLFARYAAALAAADRQRTLQKIEVYLAGWREKLGSGSAEHGLASADLLSRLDMLLADVKRLVAHAESRNRDVAV